VSGRPAGGCLQGRPKTPRMANKFMIATSPSLSKTATQSEVPAIGVLSDIVLKEDQLE
jgi:hypothetical protein